MIKTVDQFLEQFAAVADNFEWRLMGRHIAAFKGGCYYDPLTALALISTGEYIPRHRIEECIFRLNLTTDTYNRIFTAIYLFGDSTSPEVKNLRGRITDLCQPRLDLQSM